MNRKAAAPWLRVWGGLFLATLLWAGMLTWVRSRQQGPGYTDEAYYASVARWWAGGRGLRVPFLWVYLGEPEDLPHPAFDYWMPLSALLAGLGAWGKTDAPGPQVYARLQRPFFLLALALPYLTWRLYRRLRPESPALWPAFMPLTAAFFLPYMPAVDAFAPLMVLGSLYVLLLTRGPGPLPTLLVGGLVGLVHLARTEGFLWLGPALLWARRGGWRSVLALSLGYLLVMAPWWVRNLQAFGAVFPPGLSRALWLTRYEDLFLYPPQALTPARWLAAGPEAWLWPRFRALVMNLRTALAVQSSGVWLPSLLWAGWRYRHHPWVRLGLTLEALLFGLMTLVFPFAGPRGAFFHALAGLQPLAWALAAAGLEDLLAWGRRARGWSPGFGHGLKALMLAGGAVAALLLAQGRLARWNQSWQTYARLAARLDRTDCPVLVNDPAMWFWATQGPALTLPAGGPSAVAAAAQRYRACRMLLEPNHPPELADLYRQPQDFDGFRYRGTWEGAHVFAVMGSAR